jgi:tetratricopeptide (TPR) repeat protein
VPARRWGWAAAGCAIAVLVWSGLTVRQLRYWRSEESLLNRMLAMAPDSPHARTGMAKYRQNHRDYAGAEREYLGVVKLDPNFLPAREGLVNIYSYEGRADEAIAQLHELMALRARRSPGQKNAYQDAFFQAGQLAYSQGFFPDAVKYFTEDLRLNPDRAEGRRLLGLAQGKLKPATKPAGG